MAYSLAIVAARLRMACAASRAWDSLAQEALEAYGEQGPLISGCCRAHFPEPVKTELRRLARLCSDESDAARAARPPRVRQTTINALAREIARKEGSGRYGPQP